MNQQEGLELLHRILREEPTDAAQSGMRGAGTQLPYTAPIPGQPDNTGQNLPPRDSVASTKCLALDFLQSKPTQTAPPLAPEALKAAAQEVPAQAQIAGKQIADETTSGAGDIASSMAAATITLEVPKITISAPVEVLSKLLQLLEKFRS